MTTAIRRGSLSSARLATVPALLCGAEEATS